MADDKTRRIKGWASIAALSLFALIGIVMFGQGATIMVKAYVAQILLEDAYETARDTEEPTKAWSWADTRVVGKIDVPHLDEQAIVLEGASGEALAFGPAHLSHTPRPGDRGTSVIAAHRDTHFSFVKHLQIGDEIVVTNIDGAPLTFKATSMRIVRWDDPGIDAHAAGHFLVLATCYPFDAVTPGPLRYIVESEKIDV